MASKCPSSSISQKRRKKKSSMKEFIDKNFYASHPLAKGDKKKPLLGGSSSSLDVDQHQEEMLEQTRAYGEINFVDHENVAKYIRVKVHNSAEESYDATEVYDELHLKVDRMSELLLRHWKLNKPNLIISVTGGAQEFIMRRHVTRKFRQGIVRAAQSAGAWIVTGGTHEGVMKHTGNAIRDYAIREADDDNHYGRDQQPNKSFNDIVCIGVATWGIVANRHLLEKNSGERRSYTLYNQALPQEALDRSEVFLDPNHTHFVLVDDGTEGKYGGEITFRAALESALAKNSCSMAPTERKVLVRDPQMDNGEILPVCCIVVEGGPGTLETVRQALDHDTPVILVKNSGRFADVLALGYLESTEEEVEHDNGTTTRVSHVSDALRKRMRKRLLSMIKDRDREANKKDASTRLDTTEKQNKIKQQLQTVDGWMDKVLYCLRRRDLITVLRLDKHNVASDLQSAILEALFKVKTNVHEVKGVMRLSLLWNRVDFVQKYVFDDNRRWTTGFFDDIAYEAISLDRVDFVKVLLRNCLRLKNFLDDAELEHLYNDAPAECLFRVLVNRYTRGPLLASLIPSNDKPQLTLYHIGKLLDDIFDDSRKHPYSTKSLSLRDRQQSVGAQSNNRRGSLPFADSTTETSESKKAMQRRIDDVEDRDLAFDLFIYCVLLNRKEMALVLFEWLDEPLAAALTAKKILRGMTDHARGIDEIREFQEAESEFEMKACQVLARCYTEQPSSARMLLLRPVPIMGNRTCLEIARTASAIKFISEKCVQTLLKRIWFGRIGGPDSRRRTLSVVGACLFPPAIFSLDFERMPQLYTSDSEKQISRSSIDFESMAEPEQHNKPSCDEWYLRYEWATKMVYFYNAPFCIFVCSMIFYVVFMAVMAYDLLINFNASGMPFRPLYYNACEIFLIIYVVSYACEELRQAISHWYAFGLSVREYFRSIWNLLDVSGIVLFAAAMILGNIGISGDTGSGDGSGSESSSVSGSGSGSDGKQQLSELEVVTSGSDSEVGQSCVLRDIGRVCYAASLIAFYMKVLHWLMAFQTFGPKVYMVGRMLREMIIFFVILIVFMLAWGVAEWSLLFPQSGGMGIALLRDVLSLSFWQIFETFYLHVMHMEPFDIFESPERCTNDFALYHNYTLPRCPARVGRTFAPIFVGIYVVLMNLLLINLLIAIFNDVISKKEVSTEHWTFQRFELVLEFNNKSSFVPPLSFLSMLRYLYAYRSRSNAQSSAGIEHTIRLPLCEQFSRRQNAMLKAWMCEMRDDCIRTLEVSRSKTSEIQLERMRVRQKTLMRDVAIGKLAAQKFLDQSDAVKLRPRPALRSQAALGSAFNVAPRASGDISDTFAVRTAESSGEDRLSDAVTNATTHIDRLCSELNEAARSYWGTAARSDDVREKLTELSYKLSCASNSALSILNNRSHSLDRSDEGQRRLSSIIALSK